MHSSFAHVDQPTAPAPQLCALPTVSNETHPLTILAPDSNLQYPISHPYGDMATEIKISKQAGAYMHAENDIEAKAFEEDLQRMSDWPPRSYRCSFCHRLFTSAQALGGHMNIHRRDRARTLRLTTTGSSNNVNGSLLSSDRPTFNEGSTSHNVKEAMEYEEYGCGGEMSVSSCVCRATNAQNFLTSVGNGSKVDDEYSIAPTCGKEAPSVDVITTPATTAFLQVAPLHKERRRIIAAFEGRRNTPKCILQQPTFCLKMMPRDYLSAFNCKKLSKYDTSSLLKDTLSSCNINIDLELRLGPKRAS